MAKKQNELQFGQVPLPQALKQYSLSKLNWSGLNRRQVIDTGALSMECNISTLFNTVAKQGRHIVRYGT